MEGQNSFIFLPPKTVPAIPGQNLKQHLHLSRSKKKTALRKRVLERWGGKCVYCPTILSIDTMTFDHVKAKSRGGDKTVDNLVPACQRCNLMRGNYESVEEFDFSVAETRKIIAIAEGIRKGEILPPKKDPSR